MYELIPPGILRPSIGKRSLPAQLRADGKGGEHRSARKTPHPSRWHSNAIEDFLEGRDISLIGGLVVGVVANAVGHITADKAMVPV